MSTRRPLEPTASTVRARPPIGPTPLRLESPAGCGSTPTSNAACTGPPSGSPSRSRSDSCSPGTRPSRPPSSPGTAPAPVAVAPPFDEENSAMIGLPWYTRICPAVAAIAVVGRAPSPSRSRRTPDRRWCRTGRRRAASPGSGGTPNRCAQQPPAPESAAGRQLTRPPAVRRRAGSLQRHDVHRVQVRTRHVDGPQYTAIAPYRSTGQDQTGHRRALELRHPGERLPQRPFPRLRVVRAHLGAVVAVRVDRPLVPGRCLGQRDRPCRPSGRGP